MLIANTAPAMRTPSATPTRKMGSAGAESTILGKQCVVLGSVCVDDVRCLKFKVGSPARYGSVGNPPDRSRSGCLRVAAGLNRPGATSMGVLISKENGVCELVKAAAAARRASRGARAASGAITA